MIVRIFRTYLLLAFLFVLFVGCSDAGVKSNDGLPTTITPPFVTVAVNDTVTAVVYLSQPRYGEGTIKISIGNADLLQTSDGKTEYKVGVGEDKLDISFRGLAAGETSIFAELEGLKVQAKVTITK